MQFHCASCQGFEKTSENKIEFKIVRCHGVLDVVSIPNSHIPLWWTSNV
jgi:hypothetical protein